MHDPEDTHSTPEPAAQAVACVRDDVRAFQSSLNPAYLWRAFATCYGPGHPPIPLPPVVVWYFLWCNKNLGALANEGKVSLRPGRPESVSGDAVRQAVGLVAKGKNQLQLFARSAEAASPRHAERRATRPRMKAPALSPAEQARQERLRKMAAGWVENAMHAYRESKNPLYLWRAFAACHFHDYPEIALPAEVVRYLLCCWDNLRSLPGARKAAPSGGDVCRALGLVRKGKNQLQIFTLQERAMYLFRRNDLPDSAAFDALNPGMQLGPGSHPIPLRLIKKWRAVQFVDFARRLFPGASSESARRELRRIVAEGRRLNGEETPQKRNKKSGLASL